ncbi:MAG: diaminopimelate decarboxylase [Alphaproteobacteria bacterium]
MSLPTLPWMVRHGLSHASGELLLDGQSLSELASRFGTPLYLYSESTMMREWDDFSKAARGACSLGRVDVLVCYSLKANPHLALVSLLALAGAGADLVSGGELARARRAGVAPERMVFAGVAKSDDELRAGLEAGILQFNVESASELFALQRLSQEMGLYASVSLRLNPNVAGGGHDKISTGRAGDKFGLMRNEVLTLANDWEPLDRLSLCGLSVHVGSQLDSVLPMARAWETMLEVFTELARLGHGNLTRADLGGGVGVDYGTDGESGLALASYESALTDFSRRFSAFVGETYTAGGDPQPLVILEPGRRLAAACGSLLSRVIRVKRGGGVVLLDAAMNDFLRTALYGARHRIMATREHTASTAVSIADGDGVMVAGPVCESSDVFAHGLAGEEGAALAALAEGDLALICDTGAYGATMSSNYNSRARACEVLLRLDGRAEVITPRETLEDMLAREYLPGT